MRKSLAAIAALGLASMVSAAARAETITINFSDYANTYLSSADGVTFSLDSGYAVNGYGTVPFVNAFGDPNELANTGFADNFGAGSYYGNYPTSEQLIFTFSSPVSGISFYFDNYGGALSGRGGTQFFTYNPSNVEVSTGQIGLCCTAGGDVTVIGTDIKTLVLDNGTGDPTGDSSSWLFGVDSLTFSTVPEPMSLALLGAGLMGLGGFAAMRGRKSTTGNISGC